jgi:hypothetical protein
MNNSTNEKRSLDRPLLLNNGLIGAGNVRLREQQRRFIPRRSLAFVALALVGLAWTKYASLRQWHQATSAAHSSCSEHLRPQAAEFRWDAASGSFWFIRPFVLTFGLLT